MNTLAQIETTVPRTVIVSPPLSDAEFERFCLCSDGVQIERTKDGIIHMNPPTGLFTSSGNSEINRQLGNWWATHQQGIVADSNAGFYLPDGSMLSPDAAYILPEQLTGVTGSDLTGFPRLCPAFVIELLSTSDSLARARAKMELWIANGALLAWLLDPDNRQVYIYGGRAPRVSTALRLEGSGPVDGFTLDLARVWDRYTI